MGRSALPGPHQTSRQQAEDAWLGMGVWCPQSIARGWEWGNGFADISSGLPWSSTVTEVEILGSSFEDRGGRGLFVVGLKAEGRFYQQG